VLCELDGLLRARRSRGEKYYYAYSKRARVYEPSAWAPCSCVRLAWPAYAKDFSSLRSVEMTEQ
jgi:hypothetical protein